MAVRTSVARKGRSGEAERRCAGCGKTFPRRELTELHLEHHDGLMYFHGDLVCGRCADRTGVER